MHSVSQISKEPYVVRLHLELATLIIRNKAYILLCFGTYPSEDTQTLTALVARSTLAATTRNTLWFMDTGPVIAVVDGARVVVVTANVFKRFNP